MKRLVALVPAVLISACAITSQPRTALDFPQAQEVRTACIVAVTTNPAPATSERGAFSGVNDAAFVQGMAKNRPVMERIAALAHEDYLATLSNWGEWRIVDARKAPVNAIKNARNERQQFADQHQKTFGMQTFVHDTRLVPFRFHPTADLREKELAALGNYAATLCDADAAIALHLDVSYETDTGIGFGGFNLGGTAKIIVNHSILIADRTGRQVALTSESVESEQTVPMVSGSVALDETFTAIAARTSKQAGLRFTRQFSEELSARAPVP